MKPNESRISPGLSPLSRSVKTLGRWGSSVWFARLVLLLFLLKMHWGVWDNWEWVMGDEAHHYKRGMLTFSDPTSAVMAKSPLHTWYFGLIGQAVKDPYLAALVHRLIVVFAAAFLTLEIFRRFLPTGLGLLAALWWSAIPLNIAPLYTVHLFAHVANLIPILIFATSKTSVGRGIGLALTLGSALFVRSETVACFVLLCVVLSGYEIWRWRKGTPLGLRRYSLSYLLPIAGVVALWSLVTSTTNSGLVGTIEELRKKAAFNFSQNYAFTYFERNPESEGNVWLVYRSICLKDFGKEEVSAGEALATNPSAFRSHFVTNAKLLPASLQLALLNATQFDRHAEMMVMNTKSKPALLGSLILLAIWLTGGYLVIRDRQTFLEKTFAPRCFGWICYLGMGLQAIPVSMVILSRSSFYLTGISFLFLLTGLCIWAIGRKLPPLCRWKGWLAVAALSALFFVPSVWAHRPPPYDVSRAILDALGDRLEYLRRDGSRMIASHHDFPPLAVYLDPEIKVDCLGTEFLMPAMEKDTPLGKQLYDQRAKFFFACGKETMSHPSYLAFAENPGEFGWKVTGMHRTGEVSWILYEPVEPYPEDLPNHQPHQEENR